ncbi:MAG: DUF4327 family protein [Gloeocapsa sp. DLM2.Bin57]|nr:MAG: DUF4327 family protein [Gloeocapsa sp. DLM2.Bin57]
MATITRSYSISMIQEETLQLVQTGRVSRQQRIYSLCQFFPNGEWRCIEKELEENDFLLRDRIIDLIPQEAWASD